MAAPSVVATKIEFGVHDLCTGAALSWFPNHVFVRSCAALWHVGESSKERIWRTVRDSKLRFGHALAVDHRRQVLWCVGDIQQPTVLFRKVWWENGKWRIIARTLPRDHSSRQKFKVAPTTHSDGRLLVWDGGLRWSAPLTTTDVEPVLINGSNCRHSATTAHVAADDTVVAVVSIDDFTHAVEKDGEEIELLMRTDVLVDGAMNVVEFDVVFLGHERVQFHFGHPDGPRAPSQRYLYLGETVVLHSGRIIYLNGRLKYCTAAAVSGIVPPRPPPWRLLEHRALWSTVPWIQRFVTTVLLCALRNDRDPGRARLPLDVWERVIALVPTHAMQPPPRLQ